MSDRQARRSVERKAKRKAQQAKTLDKRLTVKRLTAPKRCDVQVVSVVDPVSGDIHIGTRRGAFGGNDEVLYTAKAEDIAGACEDVSELAKLINNLGMLVLAKLTGFDLVEGKPEEWPAAIARWAHLDLQGLQAADEAESLSIRSASFETTNEAAQMEQARYVMDKHKDALALMNDTYTGGKAL